MWGFSSPMRACWERRIACGCASIRHICRWRRRGSYEFFEDRRTAGESVRMGLVVAAVRGGDRRLFFCGRAEASRESGRPGDADGYPNGARIRGCGGETGGGGRRLRVGGGGD